MAHPSSTQSLRDEFPALALTVGFASPAERDRLADLLLLWLEINRARNAAESVIAAARITWWREALDNNRAEGVPLAERILASGRDLSSVSIMLARVVGITLDAASTADNDICYAMGDMLASMVNRGKGASEIAQALMTLRSAMGGEDITPDRQTAVFTAKIPTPFKLMAWLSGRPQSLNYPESDPLLPLKMMVRAFRL